MKTVNVSIAMTTYNGEKFIIQQLESIRKQTLTPNEVIICDDQSTDNTLHLVREYIYRYRLDNWVVYENEQKLGWTGNFYKAAQKTTGDIVFFSDQDDYWLEDKIEIMTNIMIDKEAECVFGYKNIIDDKGFIIPARQERKKYSHKVKKVKFKKNFFHTKVLGCCMCISKSLKDFYISLSVPEAGHDSQCARLALLNDSLWELDRAVINYRIHDSNTSGISANGSFGKSNSNKRKNEISTSIVWLEKLLTTDRINSKNKNTITTGIIVQQTRLKYLNFEKHFISLLVKLGYYQNVSMLIGDYAYKHNMNDRWGMFRWKIRRR